MKTRNEKAVVEAAKRVADEVNWSEYFASIVSVCPWSKKYWSQQKIDIQEWTGEILALDDYVARVYKHPLASAKQLESMMNTFNDERPDEEWLYSSPEYGGHSTPIGVLIQQDYNLLNRIRKSLKSNKYT